MWPPGGPHDRLLYSNPVKKSVDIRWAAQHGVNLFVADSTDEIDKLAAEAPGSRVLVRIATEPSTGVQFDLSVKFGTPVHRVNNLLQYSQLHGLVPAGVSFHVGSQCVDLSAWTRALTELVSVVNLQHIHDPILNCGGGFPVQYGTCTITRGPSRASTARRLFPGSWPNPVA